MLCFNCKDLHADFPAANGGKTDACVVVTKADAEAVLRVQTQSSTAAHSAGLIAFDAKADLLATAGYGTRQGRVIAETHVKVSGRAPAVCHLLPALCPALSWP